MARAMGHGTANLAPTANSANAQDAGEVSMRSSLFKVCVSHLTIIGFARHLDIVYPSAVSELMEGMGDASEPMDGLLSVDCSLQDAVSTDTPAFFLKQLIAAALPAALALAMLLALLVVYAVRSRCHFSASVRRRLGTTFKVSMVVRVAGRRPWVCITMSPSLMWRCVAWCCGVT